jgi:uncharacterized protein (DUF1810 family)
MTLNATLARFVDAQANSYATALSEICAGAKRSHWMWFIFPQLRGLGLSPTAHHYGIASIEEARAYLDHPTLGPRYRECVETVQQLGTSNPAAVFGTIDAMKLRSSLPPLCSPRHWTVGLSASAIRRLGRSSKIDPSGDLSGAKIGIHRP